MFRQPRALPAPAVSAGHLLPALCCGLLLSGCEFFITPPEPPPDPATDGVLACGEVMNVDGLPPGAQIPLEVATYDSVQVLIDLDDPQQIGRLRNESETSLQRALPVWDPVLGRTSIPGYRGSGEDLLLELIGATEEVPFSGFVSLECSSPGEVCFNLSDDDGDGAVDCADIHCARDPRCVEDQHDLDERVLACGTDFETLTPADARRAQRRGPLR